MINWNNFFFFLGIVCVVVMLFTFDVSFVELWGHICRWHLDCRVWHQRDGLDVGHQRQYRSR